MMVCPNMDVSTLEEPLVTGDLPPAQSRPIILKWGGRNHRIGSAISSAGAILSSRLYIQESRAMYRDEAPEPARLGAHLANTHDTLGTRSYWVITPEEGA